MKHKYFAAPLLSLTFLILFFQPLKIDELNKEPKTLTEQQMPGPGLTELAAAAYRSAGVSLSADVTQRPASPLMQVLAGTALKEAGFPGERVEELTPDLREFIAQVSEGGSGTDLGGVHIQDVLSLEVEQQPEGRATYVSSEPGTVTQFVSAARNGVTGLLAHNYLSGKDFYNIALGQEVDLIYEDGRLKRYRVSDIQSFQKLTPSSLRSDFIDLENGRQYSTTQVFNRFYTGGDHVTFQTCLEGEGISNWGLTFFVAAPFR